MLSYQPSMGGGVRPAFVARGGLGGGASPAVNRAQGTAQPSASPRATSTARYGRGAKRAPIESCIEHDFLEDYNRFQEDHVEHVRGLTTEQTERAVPIVGKEPDLFNLYAVVCSLGGFGEHINWCSQAYETGAP
mmetsp:Transcript_6239/g.17468  ORF Transcript_6239/g.17468 Transcript_6239/m.17468 type:complete len:134 (+) Transcript_6239:279-680(+)